jgi:uracil-DNA glycosylase
MKIKGWDLDYFNSGEWQVVNEHLQSLEKVNRRIGSDGYNPGRESLFRALRLTPYSEVRVAIIGQDPYPSDRHATGVAFSLPDDLPASEWPPTFRTFIGEYSADLRRPLPTNGSLEQWCARGVLLWNAIPSCRTGVSLSHDFPGGEWDFLTEEIVRKLSDKGIVFALLGQVARRSLEDIDLRNNEVLITSHPSPRGSRSSHNPFIGSRLFSTINDKLNSQGLEPIDWSL